MMNLKNNLLVSFRHLKSDKINTLISIAGLILGLGIVAVVLVFILNEITYDSSFANKGRIFRVLNYSENDNNTWANTPFVIGETSKDKFAEVEDYAHQYNIGNIEVKKGDIFVPEKEMICTERAFFGIFGVEILQGSLADFDKTKGKVLLSKKLAGKYFGSGNPIGKQLDIRYEGKEFPMEVAAVYNDLPQNSSIKASLIASIDFGLDHLANSVKSVGEAPGEYQFRAAWQGVFFTNYLLLKKGADVSNFGMKLQQMGKENSTDGNKLSLSLQPLSDVYFGSAKIVDNNRVEQGNLSMLVILGFIGLLILIVAVINYLNLASAQTISQIKAVAVRKVCGAPQKSIVSQMVFESVLVSLLALPFALVAAMISLPFMSEMLGKSYYVGLNHQILLSLSSLVLITVISGILPGSLIAFRSARLSLVNVLKGNKAGSGNKHIARKALAIFQIAVFISLVATLFLVQKQVHYVFNKDLGFAKEGLIRVPLGDHNLELFKREILKNPNVLNASGTLWMPPSENKMYISVPKVSNHNEMVKVNGLFVDYDFAKTMGMKIIMGSDFDREKTSGGVLVNESAIKTLGLTDILGEQTAFGKVVGVVSDFNMYSLHETITPMIIGLNPGMSRDVAIRLRAENLPESIGFLKKAWENTGGATAFSFDFTDDILKNIYSSDIRFSKTIGMLAAIAVVIASLGLFGLSLLMSKQRIKEVGIRKVNGAKVSEIMVMLNGDFVKWVAIAFVVATPFSYYAMHQWLGNFAYKTALSWWIFALAGILALGIALLTVSWQSWRSATRNPVEALRYE